MMLYINLTITLLGRNLARLARIWTCIRLHIAIPMQYTSENSEVIHMEIEIHMIESCVHGFHLYQNTNYRRLPSIYRNATNPCTEAVEKRAEAIGHVTCKIPAFAETISHRTFIRLIKLSGSPLSHLMSGH